MKLTKDHYILSGIFVVALIIRLILTVKSANIPSSDAAGYDMLGLSLAQGKGFTDIFGNPYSFYPPGYPFFLSIIYRLFGHSYLAVRAAQSIVGSLNCVLIWLIAKALGSKKAGIIAAIAAIVYFPFIKSTELLLTELFFTFLLLLLTFLFVKVKPPKILTFKNTVIAGFLLGAAVLTRATMIFYVLFVLPVFFFSMPGQSANIFKKYLVLCVVFVLTVLPWTIRNYVVYHKIVPVATQGGITLYSSYCPPGGIFGRLAGEEDPVIAEAGRISSQAEQSDFLVKKTIDFIKKNPAKACVLELKKILYFWAPFDWEIVGGKWFNIIYLLSAPFFIYGFVIACREFKKFYPILSPIIYFQIMTLIFYGSPRFRLPIEPFLFILSAVGLLKLYESYSAGKTI